MIVDRYEPVNLLEHARLVARRPRRAAHPTPRPCPRPSQPNERCGLVRSQMCGRITHRGCRRGLLPCDGP